MIDYAAFVDWIAVSVPVLVFFGFVWAPKTWTPGELVTASAMNTNIRDHLNETLLAQLSTVVGIQNDFDVEGPHAYIKFNNATTLFLSGMLVDGGNIDGSRVVIENIGSSSVTLGNESSGSQTSNRFATDTVSDILLGPKERALAYYDTANTRWRVGKMSTGGIAQTIGTKNLFSDPWVLVWPYGDTVAPAGATLTVDGNSGLGRSTTTQLFGGMAPELKLGNTATASSSLKWVIFATIPVEWRGKTIGIGAYIRTGIANMAFMRVQDGGTGGTTNSARHSGNSTWTWIKFTHTFTNDATKLEFLFRNDIVAQGASIQSSFIDGITVTKGPSAPEDAVGPIATEGVLYFPITLPSVATDVRRFMGGRPFIVQNVTLEAATQPTGSALIVDVNHWTGASFVSMFGATKPNVAAASWNGGKNPDGLYRYRCFDGVKNSNTRADGLLNFDVDQVGSTVAGANLQILIRILQFQDPSAGLEPF